MPIFAFSEENLSAVYEKYEFLPRTKSNLIEFNMGAVGAVQISPRDQKDCIILALMLFHQLQFMVCSFYVLYQLRQNSCSLHLCDFLFVNNIDKSKEM
jgi:hypothetical protein